MLEIAIVGAGICGLTLGRELAARGVSFALFEARERLGGRVLSVQNPTSGERLDLGPTWFWPDTQPAVRRLAEELGLERFDQMIRVRPCCFPIPKSRRRPERRPTSTRAPKG